MNKNEILVLNEENFGFWNIYRRFCLKKKNNEQSINCQELYKKLFEK